MFQLVSLLLRSPLTQIKILRNRKRSRRESEEEENKKTDTGKNGDTRTHTMMMMMMVGERKKKGSELTTEQTTKKQSDRVVLEETNARTKTHTWKRREKGIEPRHTKKHMNTQDRERNKTPIAMFAIIIHSGPLEVVVLLLCPKPCLVARESFFCCCATFLCAAREPAVPRSRNSCPNFTAAEHR